MKNIIIIAGPTGVGKTATSVKLALRMNSEIISADSMQIYKNMDIGTAKISKSETNGIIHHMIDIVNPNSEFSVSEFEMQSTQIINEMFNRKITPILVGGTGLYINSLMYEMDYNEVPEDPELRNELWNYYDENGSDKLFELLIKMDPYTKIDSKNIKRVIRAIEILKKNGKISDFKETRLRSDFGSKLFVLYRERKSLYNIIDKRVDKMVEDGLLQEVKLLLKEGVSADTQSMKAIGYRQILTHLKGECSLDEAIDIIKRDSRRYAKRQLTWFKRYENAIWIDVERISEDEIVNIIEENKKI